MACRLGDVIIGAHFESNDTIYFFATRRAARESWNDAALPASGRQACSPIWRSATRSRRSLKTARRGQPSAGAHPKFDSEISYSSVFGSVPSACSGLGFTLVLPLGTIEILQQLLHEMDNQPDGDDVARILRPLVGRIDGDRQAGE